MRFKLGGSLYDRTSARTGLSTLKISENSTLNSPYIVIMFLNQGHGSIP